MNDQALQILLNMNDDFKQPTDDIQEHYFFDGMVRIVASFTGNKGQKVFTVLSVDS